MQADFIAWMATLVHGLPVQDIGHR